MCGYAAAYVHSFCMLYCVERHVDMSTQILTSDFNQNQKAPWWWSADDRNMLEGF
jgi:hypothetical protein